MNLYATELVGSAAFDAQGNFVGRVREFFVEPAEAPNRVSHYLLSRGKYQPLIARHDQVASVEPGKVTLNVGERALREYVPNESLLAVQKDLLDQQIIDISGRKVVRVNDVEMAEQRANGNVELRITQVDVGLPGAVRRLLQGLPSKVIRKLEKGLPQKAIRWEFVNLIEPDPLRRLKLRITHEKLEDLHPADLAEMMEQLSTAERQGIIASLDEETAAAVLGELDRRLSTQIVEKLDPEKAADILEEMAPDAAADVLADLPKETSEELLDEMPGQEANEVRELLEYDPKTAGGMMNPEFVFVGEDSTRYEVLAWMKRQDEMKFEQLDTIVLVDPEARFSGTVPVVRMMLAGDDQPMKELKAEPLLSVGPMADDKEVFELFDKYNLRTLTVIDEESRPMGTITVDDVVSQLVNR